MQPLETILARCAAGEPSAAGELRRWQGNRLLTTLERILGDPRVASQVMDNLLADVLSHAGAHRATGATAEDWLFARLRFQVREAQRPGSAGPPLRARPASAGGGHAAAARRASACQPGPCPPPRRRPRPMRAR